MQLIAKRYIEENDLERIISEMLNSLVHERVKQPLVYMIKYLAGLMTEEERKINGLIIPEPFPIGQPIAKYPYLSHDSLLKKYLSKELFKDIKYLKTKENGSINSIIKLSENFPQDNIGCQIIDGDSIRVFSNLFTPIIDDYHNIDSNYLYKDDLKDENLEISFPFFNNNQKFINKFSISVTRNLKNYPYANTCTSDKRDAIERELTLNINKLIDNKSLPELNNISFSKENEEQWNNILNYINYESDKEKQKNLQLDFPKKRKIYFNNDLSLIILINFSEHLEIIGFNNEKTDENNIINTINKINNIERIISKKVEFDYDEKYGYLNCDIKRLGNSIKLNIEITCKKLNPENSNKTIEDLIEGLDFYSYDINSISNDEIILNATSYFKLCDKNQISFIEDFYSKISGLINFNRDNKMNYDKIIFPVEFNPLDENIKKAYEKNFEKEEFKITSSGKIFNSIFDYYLKNPNNEYGIFLDCPSEIYTFNDFINNYLLLSQSFEIENQIKNQNINNNFQLKNFEKEKIISVDICLMRNIENYPFSNCEINENNKVEELIINVLNTLNLRSKFGTYFSLDNENQRTQAEKIIRENNLKIYDKNLNINNRGIIQFNFDKVYAIINDIDHIKFFLHSIKPGEKFNEDLFNVLKTVNEFSKQIKFLKDSNYGFITSSPKFLGSGFYIEMKIKVKLEENQLEKICKIANESLLNMSSNKDSKYEFCYQILYDEMDNLFDLKEKIVLIKNQITLGKSENEVLGDILYFISQIFLADTKSEIINK